MVAFLGYALWVTLKHLLKRRPTLVPKPSASEADHAHPLSPLTALALLATLQSADIVLPTTDGHEIRLPHYRDYCRAEITPPAAWHQPARTSPSSIANVV
jgi:hypothetical protein